MRQARIGVDIGGTFTDLVLLDSDGQVFFAKVSSTPAAPEEAVLTGVAQILAQAGLGGGAGSEGLHGTTVGANTLLPKGGAKTGLITTKGFRDVLEIGRVRTPTMFDFTWSKAEPLVARRFRRERRTRRRRTVRRHVFQCRAVRSRRELRLVPDVRQRRHHGHRVLHL